LTLGKRFLSVSFVGGRRRLNTLFFLPLCEK